jgi:hypothetical protein
VTGATGATGAQGLTGPPGPAGSGTATIVTYGTYGDGTVWNGDPAITLTHTGVGQYTLRFTPGYWSGGEYPVPSITSFFGGPQAQIVYASSDGTQWDLQFGSPPVDTTFSVMFVS